MKKKKLKYGMNLKKLIIGKNDNNKWLNSINYNNFILVLFIFEIMILIMKNQIYRDFFVNMNWSKKIEIKLKIFLEIQYVLIYIN